ncbi:hypothetical protein CONCODRAFT_67650 [Conidiobolus coronatus NRRL 28638]|uniref:Arrestin C-terminal-like domain-containing protein n=1 Tax=Conidiobolus coronatus (strain ATCC 28846 / CBS 209.66 / NRRL 28638) TaxID=796925 RepID=A0A137PH70_CONC2|nr:hypothetical protein CONCODRAFT_67650 [Conidiobolus coronatus NRRL 28638]|eukprot:KXN74330.1 hypothetical protein CONCODRAFT_67650 [Conidiobolus coronatus NRRL 28638]
MISIIKTLLPSSLNSNPLQIDFDLISTEIYVPEAARHLDNFSFQGKLKITTMGPITIKNLNIQFSGYMKDSQAIKKRLKSFKVIENAMEVLNRELEILNNSYEVNFELLLPRSLLPTINSNSINLNYILSASVNYNSNSQSSCQIPIKVYNNQLNPCKNAFSTKFHYTGSINDNISYIVDFSKRLFTTRDSINLWVTINPREGAEISSVEATLLQSIVNLYNTDRVSDGGNDQDVEFDKIISLILKKSTKSLTEFKLATKWAAIKRVLIPSITSAKFKVKHSIKILINYKLNGGEQQTRYILIPIFIEEFGRRSEGEIELPVYREFEIEEIQVPVDEKAPVYTD